MTERSKEIVSAVIKERQVSINGVTFLIWRFAGENVVVPASPEVVALWHHEIVEEAIRRISDAELSEARRNINERRT